MRRTSYSTGNCVACGRGCHSDRAYYCCDAFVCEDCAKPQTCEPYFGDYTKHEPTKHLSAAGWAALEGR